MHSASPGGERQAALLSTYSPMPPTSLVTIGSPQAIASSSELLAVASWNAKSATLAAW
jgi:hypothetical protein